MCSVLYFSYFIKIKTLLQPALCAITAKTTTKKIQEENNFFYCLLLLYEYLFIHLFLKMFQVKGWQKPGEQVLRLLPHVQHYSGHSLLDCFPSGGSSMTVSVNWVTHPCTWSSTTHYALYGALPCLCALRVCCMQYSTQTLEAIYWVTFSLICFPLRKRWFKAEGSIADDYIIFLNFTEFLYVSLKYVKGNYHNKNEW